MPQSQLVQLFERALRDLEKDTIGVSDSRKRRKVDRELDEEIVRFAQQVRLRGSTPEQMLVELKKVLASAAPEIPGSQRQTLVATITGRAIDAYFDGTGKKAE